MVKLTGLGLVLGLLTSPLLWAQGKLPDAPPIPKDNPMSAAKIELGKTLYFDPRISSSGNVSCNSCHNIMAGGDDSRAVSVGIKGLKGGRSSPTVWNSAFLSVQFWDGRAPTLEEQAKGPLINPVEMGMKNHDIVIDVIRKLDGYQSKFTEVFGKNSLNIENVAKAIAAFERTLITPNSPYDRCQSGDKKFCNPEAEKGWQVMQATGCLTCHSGPIFAGPPLPEGIGFFQKFPTFEDNAFVKKYKFKDDLGRFDVTKSEADKNMWRVPTLRNVAVTAPYFHNGSVATLGEAVRVMAKTQLNKDLKNDEVKAIVAFLESLTGEFPKFTFPQLPLKSGSSVILEAN